MLQTESKKIILHYPDGGVRIVSRLAIQRCVVTVRDGNVSMRHFYRPTSDRRRKALGEISLGSCSAWIDAMGGFKKSTEIVCESMGRITV